MDNHDVTTLTPLTSFDVQGILTNALRTAKTRAKSVAVALEEISGGRVSLAVDVVPNKADHTVRMVVSSRRDNQRVLTSIFTQNDPRSPGICKHLTSGECPAETTYHEKSMRCFWRWVDLDIPDCLEALPALPKPADQLVEVIDVK